MMESFLQDLRYAVRGMARNPGFTAAVVATLALGIGANTTMFGVVDVLMFRAPAHVREPDRVVRLYFSQTSPVFGHFTQQGASYPTYAEMGEGVEAFSSVGAVWVKEDIGIGRGPSAEQVRGGMASHTLFGLLGVAPALGRFFGASEDRPGGDHVAVLGYGYWRRRFAADALVLGRSLLVGRSVYALIGVAPEGFNGTGLDQVDLWLPVAVAGPEMFEMAALTNRGDVWLDIVGRLKPGATRERAAAEATAVFRRGDAARTWSDPKAEVLLGPIQEARGPGASRDAKVSVWLGCVAAIVLLIACANVANLLLARALRRRREITVRVALGAGRGRLVRQLLTESVVLALLGGAAALLVALWGGPLVRAYVLPEGVAAASPIDGRALAFTALAALLTGVLSGLIPALQMSRPDLASALKAGERDGTYQRSTVRSMLLVGQTALTLVLLVGAGLFARSLKNALGLDLGLDTRHLLVAKVDLQGSGYTRTESDALYRSMLERTRSLPGVEHAAVTLGGPFGWGFARSFKVPGLDSVPILSSGGPYYNAVTPDFFATMGTPMLRGRGFTAADLPDATKVTVVGQTMARLLWPGRDPLGQCIKLSGDSTCTIVVGVAADARRTSLLEGPQMQYYVPLGQADNGMRHLFLRTALKSRVMVETVRRALAEVAPDLPYVSVRPLQERVDVQLKPWRLGAAVFSSFGILALVLAALGLYGVLAYTVAQRTHEMGVRMALGAAPGAVSRLVIWQGVRVVGVGLALGLVTAFAAGRMVASVLYGVKPGDPLVLAGAVAVLLAVAAVASYLPARRATRVDPVVALRYE